MTLAKQQEMVQKAREFFEKAGIIVRDDEEIEVADFGLNRVEEIGLQICVYVNTERVCAKEMVLLPFQTCPEHWHIPSYGI